MKKVGYILLYIMYTFGLYQTGSVVWRQMQTSRPPDFLMVGVIPIILLLMWRDLGGSAPRRLHVLLSTAALVIVCMIQFKRLPMLIPQKYLTWMLVLASIWTVIWAADSIWEKVHLQNKAKQMRLSKSK